MKSGKSSFAFPVKMWFLDAPESLLQVGFIAPKRRYRRATDRNRQKRLLREAYRRSPVRPPVDLPLTIVFMSVGPTEIDQKTVQKAMDALLLQLKNHLNDHPSD
jgi:ribonuclease P protein component